MTANPAESHSRPLGSEEKTRGIIQEKNRVDLNKAPFNYGDDRSYSHSAQFLGTNMLRHTYWARLLKEFGFDPIDEFDKKIKKGEGEEK